MSELWFLSCVEREKFLFFFPSNYSTYELCSLSNFYKSNHNCLFVFKYRSIRQIKQSFPNDKSKIFPFVADCVKQFQNDERYLKDIRFLKICIQYVCKKYFLLLSELYICIGSAKCKLLCIVILSSHQVLSPYLSVSVLF